MFRFRLAGIPVDVHLAHLVINLMFAWLFAGGERMKAQGWPAEVLARAEDPLHTATLVGVVFGWMALISGSVLLHELGHAFALRAFGLAPDIQLNGLGGVTGVRGGFALPWHAQLLASLAGPAMSVGLVVLCAGGLLWLRSQGAAAPVLAYFLWAGLTINGLYTVFNLMPLMALDGGQLVTIVCTRLFGPAGILHALVFSQVFALTAAVFSLLAGVWVVALMFLLFFVRALVQLVAMQAPPQELPHLFAVRQASSLLDAGKLGEARALAAKVVADRADARSVSHAHLVLAQVALQQSRGADALGHLARLQHVAAPPEALAAAFTLVGDDARALPHWQAAHRVSPDSPSVARALADTLLRLGRYEEARAVAGAGESAADDSRMTVAPPG